MPKDGLTQWAELVHTTRRPGWPLHIGQLQAGKDYATLRPMSPSDPSVCIVSRISQDLLNPQAYGDAAIEVNANWALAHGHVFIVFFARLAPNNVSFTWTNPRSALFALQHGPDVCAWVMHMDADAVVNDVALSAAAFINMNAGRETHLIFACHFPFSATNVTSDCALCSCGSARSADNQSLCPAMPGSKAGRMSSNPISAQMKRNPGCNPNVGVYFVRNSPLGQRMVGWWAKAGDGECDWRSTEQICTRRLKANWPRHVDIVNSALMNTHAAFSEVAWRSATSTDPFAAWQRMKDAYHNATLPEVFRTRRTWHAIRNNLTDVERRVRQAGRRLRAGDVGWPCFGSRQWICHPMGSPIRFHQSRERGGPLFQRRRSASMFAGMLQNDGRYGVFRAHRTRVRDALLRRVRERGESYFLSSGRSSYLSSQLLKTDQTQTDQTQTD